MINKGIALNLILVWCESTVALKDTIKLIIHRYEPDPCTVECNSESEVLRTLAKLI